METKLTPKAVYCTEWGKHACIRRQAEHAEICQHELSKTLAEFTVKKHDIGHPRKNVNARVAAASLKNKHA